MKKILFLIGVYVFFSLSAFSQEEEESTEESVNKKTIAVIDKVIEEKPRDYFQLKKLLKNSNMTVENLKYLEEQSEKNKYDLGQIYALHLLGIGSKNISKYPEAIDYIDQALEIAEKDSDTTSKILLSNTVGAIYRKQNDIENALMYHQNAILEAEKIKNPSDENIQSIAIANNGIGNIYTQLKQYKLALENFNEALKIQQVFRDLKGLAVNYQNIGFAQEQLGNIDKALKDYKKSLDYNIQNNSVIGEIICNNSISRALIKKGEFVKALQLAEENFEKVKALKNRFYYVQTISNLGWAYVKTGQFDKAKPLLEESLQIAEKFNFKNYEINSFFYLSELYTALGNYEKAFYYHKKAIEIEKETTVKQQSSYLNELISKFKAQPKITNLKLSQSESKIKDFENNRNRNVLIITLISLALLSVALYSIYRQRLLNNDRRVLLLEQQALQAQMNPHFIFNALNSIKLYIINKEQKNAVYYLNKFSKLIRNILDVSKVKDVSLKEELDTMDLYMSIENIRFNNEIEYSKKINESLNLDTIRVPPLLLQPFLENSIWHGLSSKDGEKEIVLSAFKVSKNLVEINIADNGVGRKTAMEIKKNKSLKRKSIGLDLTKERLKTFASDFDNDYSLKYYDLQDKTGKALGTKVAIRIPLK